MSNRTKSQDGQSTPPQPNPMKQTNPPTMPTKQQYDSGDHGIKTGENHGNKR